MEINIIIKVDGEEVVNQKIQEPKEESKESYSQYARFFDETCPNWTKDAEMNLLFLKQQQLYLSDMLKNQGYLFLNDAYAAIGVPKTKEGQIVGWIYDLENPIGDNYVDFGIYDTTKERNRDFVNGYETNILLDFNVDGNILDKLK